METKNNTKYRYYLDPFFSRKTLEMLAKALEVFKENEVNIHTASVSKKNYLEVMEKFYLHQKELFNFRELFHYNTPLTTWQKNANKKILLKVLNKAFEWLYITYETDLLNTEKDSYSQRVPIINKWNAKECHKQLVFFINEKL